MLYGVGNTILRRRVHDSRMIFGRHLFWMIATLFIYRRRDRHTKNPLGSLRSVRGNQASNKTDQAEDQKEHAKKDENREYIERKHRGGHHKAVSMFTRSSIKSTYESS